MDIYKKLVELRQKKRSSFAVLIDPEKYTFTWLDELFSAGNASDISFILVGGSTSSASDTSELIKLIKQRTTIPILIFPGPETRADNNADAFMLLSLISGRNPDYLIGKHVLTSIELKKSGLEVLPTGYILVEGSNISTTQYISGTIPIPADKPELAVATAIAGEQLGLKGIYLEAGSGAKKPVSLELIKAVSKNCSLPLFVGGGIRTVKQINNAIAGGATVVVIGTALEKRELAIKEIAAAFKK